METTENTEEIRILQDSSAEILNSGSRDPPSSSRPNQTHLNKRIKVFGITRKLQAGEFDQG